jgi:hypothetical protein
MRCYVDESIMNYMQLERYLAITALDGYINGDETQEGDDVYTGEMLCGSKQRNVYIYVCIIP